MVTPIGKRCCGHINSSVIYARQITIAMLCGEGALRLVAERATMYVCYVCWRHVQVADTRGAQNEWWNGNEVDLASRTDWANVISNFRIDEFIILYETFNCNTNLFAFISSCDVI